MDISPTQLVNCKIQARRAANEIRDAVEEIKDIEWKLDAWLKDLFRANRNLRFSSQALAVIKHEFRQTLVDSKIRSWYPWIRHEAMWAQYFLNEDTRLENLVSNFKARHKIPRDQAYVQIVDYFKDQLETGRLPSLVSAASLRSQRGTPREEHDLAHLRRTDAQDIVRLRKREALKNDIVDLIDWRVRLTSEMPSAVEQRILLNEVARDFTDIDRQLLQELMENVLSSKLRKKFSRLQSSESSESPRVVMFSPRAATVVVIPDAGAQRPTPPRESHFRPLRRPLPKNLIE